MTEEAYRRLRARKGESESFSEVIVRLTARPPLASFAGTLTSASAKRLRTAIEKDRELRARQDRVDAARH